MSLNVFLCHLENKYHRPQMVANTRPICGEHITYPGSFKVLFIEHAKCFPTEVNRSGR
jgi:hypothetical protein